MKKDREIDRESERENEQMEFKCWPVATIIAKLKKTITLMMMISLKFFSTKSRKSFQKFHQKQRLMLFLVQPHVHQRIQILGAVIMGLEIDAVQRLEVTSHFWPPPLLEYCALLVLGRGPLKSSSNANGNKKVVPNFRATGDRCQDPGHISYFILNIP